MTMRSHGPPPMALLLPREGGDQVSPPVRLRAHRHCGAAAPLAGRARRVELGAFLSECRQGAPEATRGTP